MSKIIEAITKSQLRTDIPEFKAGDTVRVHVRIVEGGRERIQQFEGVVIKTSWWRNLCYLYCT